MKKDPNMQPRDDVVKYICIHVGVSMVILCAYTFSIGVDLEGRKMFFNVISFLIDLVVVLIASLDS